MLQRLSQGNNPNCIIRTLNEDNYNYSLSEETDSDMPIFAIRLSFVSPNKYRQIEDLVRIRKIESMFANVRSVLFRIPFEVHTQLSGGFNN
jgi:hypothetical protein